MFKHITSKFIPSLKLLIKPFPKRFIPGKIELKKDKEKEEYLDVDNADREEFSNKWNLPRNSP